MNYIEVNWDNLKEFCQSRGVIMQYIDINDNYYLRAFDDVFAIGMILPKSDPPSPEQTDFETNFKSTANKKLALSTDSENAPIQRMKMAPSGWTYKLRGIEFATSSNRLDSFSLSGELRTDITLRHFDADGIELPDLGMEPGASHPLCVTTWVDWEPDHDYEIIGGTVKILNATTQNCRMWVIAVPDVPYQYGGSRIMADNINFKFISPNDKVEADGRVSKKLSYNPQYHSNKLRLVFKHEPGAIHNFHLFLEFYKP